MLIYNICLTEFQGAMLFYCSENSTQLIYVKMVSVQWMILVFVMPVLDFRKFNDSRYCLSTAWHLQGHCGLHMTQINPISISSRHKRLLLNAKSRDQPILEAIISNFKITLKLEIHSKFIKVNISKMKNYVTVKEMFVFQYSRDLKLLPITKKHISCQLPRNICFMGWCVGFF